MRRIPGLAIVFALCSCTEPRGLLGTWRQDTAEVNELTLDAWTYSQSYDYGDFYGTTTGTYSLVGDSIEFRPAHHLSRTANGAILIDDYQLKTYRNSLKLRGDTLLLGYVSAPFDVAVPASTRFIRR